MMKAINTFGPDGATLDAIEEAITKATASCHEAIERHDWQQVVSLANCLKALERSFYTVRQR